jgi:prevent-host-death family protein
MKKVSISEFKSKRSELLQQVSLTGEPVRVTQRGKAVADLIPPRMTADRASWIGSMKDSIEILGDIVAPANEETDWDALRERVRVAGRDGINRSARCGKAKR